MYELIEPRIEAIKREIERILSLVELESNGRSVKADGFRLRDLSEWRTGSAQNAFDALGPLSGTCNAKCVFCMEKAIPFERNNSFLSPREARTRLKHYSPETGKCLIPAARPHMENLLNRDAVEILKCARQASPRELFVITTNGTTLTPEVVEGLRLSSPLLIKLSVNSTDPAARKAIMGLRDSMNGVQRAMTLLKGAGIPFTGSIVAWPEAGQEEIERSLREVSSYDPYGIRVRLPIVHKYTPSKPEADMDAFWSKTCSLVDSIKGSLDVPIWIEPVQYGRPALVPIVDGVIKNSPAMKAGVLPGDIMVNIDGEPAISRPDIRRLFSTGVLDGRENLSIEVERGSETLRFELGSGSCAAYPYDPGLRHPGERFGLLFLPDFDFGYIENMLRLIIKHGARKVLLFSSPLTAGTVERLIDEVDAYREFFSVRDLWIYTLEDTWMEGNTRMLDSRFVDDYEKALMKVCMGLNDRPDLILIPDAFGSAWGIDFRGRSVFEIEARTGVPVELIPWHYIYGKED